MAASFTRLRPVAEIPTLSQLYKSGQLAPAVQEDLPNASQKLNDTVCHVQHSITRLQVDAIVNAANEYLLGGGGIDGAIHRAAGPGLLKECRTLHGCKTGSAKITGAYELPCKKVIHAVGPIFTSIDESEPLLRSCYRKSLELAVDNDCKSIALCGISTGIYGYPPTAAAEAALHEVRDFLTHTEKGTRLEKVIFCSFNNQDVASYIPNIPKHFPPTSEDLEKKSTPGNRATSRTTSNKLVASNMAEKRGSQTDNFPNSDNLKIPTMYNTNIHSGLEADIRGEVAENADEPNTKKHNTDFQREGTEQRSAKLHFPSAGLDCDITTTVNRLAIAAERNQKRTVE